MSSFSQKEKYLGGLTPGDAETVLQKRVTETILGGECFTQDRKLQTPNE